MREVPCPRVRRRPAASPQTLAVTVDGSNISEVCALPIGESAKLLGALELSERDRMIAERVLKEINARLGFLLDVGLDYLTLDRRRGTLAGGEAQRIRLASQIGSGARRRAVRARRAVDRPAPARQPSADRDARRGCATSATP